MSGDNRLPIDLTRFDAAVFDLDGVVTRTADVHAAAWKQVFDTLLQRDAARIGRPVVPFDSHLDYLRHVDGKPRLDGVRDFLASRGITLPEGVPDDPAEALTVHGIGNAKNQAFRDRLLRDGVAVYDSSVSLLRAMRIAGLRIALVSASKNTADILAVAGVADLFDVRIDGLDAERLHLPGKPAPDTFLRAAHLLGIAPSRAIGVEDAQAGVAALRSGGFGLVIGVDRSGQAAALSAAGADIVVPDLAAIVLGTDTPCTPMPADPGWFVEERGHAPERETAVESLFAIGNGYVGSRASLAEGSATSSPATFAAGLFHRTGDEPPGLMRLPDWANLSIVVADRMIGLGPDHMLRHRRILDLRHGMIRREWDHRDDQGVVSRIDETRFASGANPHLLVQSVTLAVEGSGSPVTLATAMPDTWKGQTNTGQTVAMVTATRVTLARGRATGAKDLALPATVTLGHGDLLRVDRIVAIRTSRDAADPEAAACTDAASALQAGAATLRAAHCRAWDAHWDARDIRIAGDPGAQRAIRFAIYHLISAANPGDSGVSIGARALTGTGYRGHVFWDTEIFMLPFFTLAWPEAARALLMYRHRTLPAARARAARLSYRGALYAWESADTGDDVTPTEVRRPDGSVIRILTGEQEHHISADVAYGVWTYWQATGDMGFLCDAGAEILLETARFWASRVRRAEDGQYHIRAVIGPDEYHEGVDDNAYTNGMARWNLLTAASAARLMAAQSPAQWHALRTRIGLRDGEAAEWRAIASQLYSGFDPRTGLIEQFQGYFALEDVDPASLTPHGTPPDVVLGRERIRQTQILKQADVVMLLCLLPDAYPRAVVEANFRYYEPRCGHGSSLSPAIHALLAARLGDTALALRYLRQAMEIDLGNNMGNAADGVHAAALGGLWQAIVLGFAGVRLKDHQPVCHANLPDSWQALAFRIQCAGLSHALHLSR